MKAKTRTKTKRAEDPGLLRRRTIKPWPSEDGREDFDVVPVMPFRTSDDLLAYVEHLEKWAAIGSSIAELRKDAEELPKLILWDLAKALRVVGEALETGSAPEMYYDPKEFRNMMVRVVRKSLDSEPTVLGACLSTDQASQALGILDPLLPSSSLESSA